MAASVSIIKYSSPTSFTTAGTGITYVYAVTNTGGVTLNNVVVTDAHLGPGNPVTPGGPSDPVNITPGTLVIFTSTVPYVTTPADVIAGSITNTGVITADLATGGAITASSSYTINSIPINSMALIKFATPTIYTAAGQTIKYTYFTLNTGATAISNVTVSDPHSGLSAVTLTGSPPANLVPYSASSGSQLRGFTATYITTASDVKNGSIVDTATASGNAGAITATGSTTVFLALACIHEASMVKYLNEDGKVEERRVDGIKSGDYILDAHSEPVRVVNAIRCLTKHHLASYSHSSIVLPVGSIALGVPDRLTVVDPGHPIATPSAFATTGVMALMPARSYLGGYSTSWDAACLLLPTSLLPSRYDLVLEESSCGAYLANGIAVQSRVSEGDAGYLHDADE